MTVKRNEKKEEMSKGGEQNERLKDEPINERYEVGRDERVEGRGKKSIEDLNV